jgi:DnaJ-class molecular chaperone
MSSNKELYTILGVDRTASDEEIRSAYEKLISETPENTPDHDRIVQAYTVLSDIEKRARYDITGKVRLKRSRNRSGSKGLERTRYALNTLFLAGAAVTTVLFILQMSGALSTTPFYVACGISLLVKISEYILRLIS